MNREIDKIYQQYFKRSEEVQPASFDRPITIMSQSNEEVLEGPLITEDLHLRADDERDCLELVVEVLQKLTNSAWGSEWGMLTIEAPSGMNPDEVILPAIAIDMNSREIQEKRSLKPRQVRTIKEVINGQATGDHLLVFQHFYDCILEVNFYGRTMMEARRLMQRFEKLMLMYTGYIKTEGVDEIFFLKEVNSKHSVNYTSQLAMKCTMYYARFGREMIVRSSSIHQIQLDFDMEIGNLEDSTSILYKED